MMGNNIIRKESWLVHDCSCFFIGLDILFIKVMNLGMTGAAYATAISILCVLYLYFGSFI
jgi:Na+-driven multidrug efflux pump